MHNNTLKERTRARIVKVWSHSLHEWSQVDARWTWGGGRGGTQLQIHCTTFECSTAVLDVSVFETTHLRNSLSSLDCTYLTIRCSPFFTALLLPCIIVNTKERWQWLQNFNAVLQGATHSVAGSVTPYVPLLSSPLYQMTHTTQNILLEKVLVQMTARKLVSIPNSKPTPAQITFRFACVGWGLGMRLLRSWWKQTQG